MAIVFRKNNQNAEILNESKFAQEDSMQEYLISNPEIVPIYEIEEDARLLVAAREFSTASGPIDALGLDEHGNIYVIETKLFKNPDKRTVLAQVMDYGAALWKHHADSSGFFDHLDEYSYKYFDQDFKEKFCSFFGIEDAVEAFDNIKSNLEDGSIKFVVLMDKLDARLKDLISYINQNSKFDIYAVELDFYKHDEFEVVIPKLYGAEVRKEISPRTAYVQKRGKWDDQSFREQVGELPVDQQRAILAIYDWAVNKSDKIIFGTGATRATVNPRFFGFNKNSFFTLYSDGQMSINFGYIDTVDKRVELMQFLNKEFGFMKFNYKVEELISQYPVIDRGKVFANYQKIIDALDKFTAKFKEKEEL